MSILTWHGGRPHERHLIVARRTRRTITMRLRRLRPVSMRAAKARRGHGHRYGLSTVKVLVHAAVHLASRSRVV